MRGGTGLGLWESHAILDLMGATIDVKSTTLQGTEVTMTFPPADEKNRQIA